MGNKVDFFVSYTKADELWAKWIAGQLENKKYAIIIQAWDFKPGDNFVSNMHNALNKCERFIAVMSPDYFKSGYCQAEWTAAFTKDPSCEKALLIPVRVKEFKPEGLFASIFYIDLYGIEEPEAVERLLNGISTDRPRNRPGFPGTSNKPKFPGQLPFNNLPFRKNPNFTGRGDILESIQKSFKLGQYTSLTQSVSGLGGVGKTQIVIEYAFRYGYLYEAIWWVNAESSHTLMGAYSSFAHKNGLVDKEVSEKDIILEAVWNWMTKHKDWLFIYDNAEDEKSLYEYLPKKDNGHILITSRYTNWRKLGEEIRIDVFVQDEAVDFLIKSTGIKDRKSATMLAYELGYLPLALDQAAAYIANNKITYEEYIYLFKKYKLEIFEDDEYESIDYSYTVAVTWNISIGKINNESSNQLLNICSFLAPDNINRNIFIKSNKCLPEPLASNTLSELKYNKVISELARYSLIRLQDNKMSIHRLLQEVIRQSVNQKEWLGYCIKSVSELFHFDYDDKNTWNTCFELLPHALSVAKHADEMCVYLEKVVCLNNVAGRWFVHTATYEEAEPLYKRAIEIAVEVLGEKNLNSAAIMNNLAILYENQGRYNEAEPLSIRALNIFEEVPGEKSYLETVACLHNLAMLYDKQGRYTEAEPLYKRALERGEVVDKGEKHPITVTCLNSLAGLYNKQGRYTEAEPLLNRVLKIRKEVPGEKHPDTANSLSDLSLLYQNQGRYKEAEPLSKRALEIKEEVMGAKHPGTAVALLNLALLYDNQGRYEEAEPLCKRACEIYEEVVGGKHPDMAASLHILAGIYINQGRYEEAEPLCIRALEIRKEVLIEKHPDTAYSFNNLAGLYVKQGRYFEAEPLYKRALEITVEVSGEKHRDTAGLISNLATLYYRQGRYKKAEPLCKSALQISEEVLGEKHPDTANCLNSLAGLYVKKERYKEAEVLFKRAFEICEEILGNKHPIIAIILINLASLYDIQGRHEEAKQLRERL